ncbi:hypothetical protein ACFQS6_23980 [Xanthomonas populi]
MSKSIARIYVNGIEVGSLPAETYQEIVKSLHKDRRLYLAWAVAAAGSIVRLLLKFYSSLPSVVVGLFLLLAVLTPDTLTGVLTDLRAAAPQRSQRVCASCSALSRWSLC